MNINTVSFGAKMPISRINILKSNKAGLENYLEELISQKGDEIEKMAEYCNRSVTLYRRKGSFNQQQNMQNVDVVYINSGKKTTRFDLTTAKNGDELISAIKDNLRINA